MQLDLDHLLTPLAPDAPSGRDVRYDQSFEALRATAELKFDELEGPGGRKVWGPLPRDFRKVRRAAEELLRVGRDLRVLVWLTEALAVTEGPVGLATGLGLIRRSLENYWDNLHPELDTSEAKPVDQAVLRLNALRSLVSAEDMLSELARMCLVEVPGIGAVSFRAWELAAGRSEPAAYETKPEPAALEIVFKAAPPEATAERLSALELAAAEVEAIDAQLMVRIGDAGALPNLGPLADLIERMRALLMSHAPAPPPTAANLGSTGAGVAASVPAAAPAGSLPARLDSRESVIQALDLAIDYYRRHEPGSPVPLLLERAKRMVTMGFLEVMAELAPDAMKRLDDLFGTQK